jgi:predicted RNA-binding protein (virulence factor B family)
MVIDILDKGLQVLVNNCFLGLVYSSDVYDEYEVGAELNGYIKKIREDGKLDIVIKKQGFSVVSEDQEKILQELKKHNNFLPLTSKSSAEEVKSVLKMSRKAFKKAIGGLYKNKVVLIKDDGIYLK